MRSCSGAVCSTRGSAGAPHAHFSPVWGIYRARAFPQKPGRALTHHTGILPLLPTADSPWHSVCALGLSPTAAAPKPQGLKQHTPGSFPVVAEDQPDASFPRDEPLGKAQPAFSSVTSLQSYCREQLTNHCACGLRKTTPKFKAKGSKSRVRAGQEGRAATQWRPGVAKSQPLQLQSSWRNGAPGVAAAAGGGTGVSTHLGRGCLCRS